MAEDTPQEDKTEEPTERRLEKAGRGHPGTPPRKKQGTTPTETKNIGLFRSEEYLSLTTHCFGPRKMGP